jgi:hypothetical protein
MSGKGSRQRPGAGYAEGWDAIFTNADASGKCPVCNESVARCACVPTEDGPGQPGAVDEGGCDVR